jgi:UDP:flavonoid glycosyltransferase YjiC (YdhE family)
MASIGLELVARGHDVLLACPENHVAFVERLGLKAHRLAGDSEELLSRPEGREWVSTGNARALLRAMVALINELSLELSENIEAACEGADVIVTGLIPAGMARANADRLGVPLVVAHTFPTLPTRNYTSALFDMPFALPSFLRPGFTRLLLHFVAYQMRGLERPLRKRYGLPPAKKETSLQQFDDGQLSLQIWSPSFIPKPPDWKASEVITGFCALPASVRPALGESEEVKRLETFLAAGAPPLYFGLGSMPVLEWETLVARLLRVTESLGLRLILSGEIDEPERIAAMLPERACFAGRSDHDVLFPRCCAVVHHGGAGSTATSLRAGRPTMICAVLGDQPFFGKMVAARGVGSWTHLRSLTEAGLYEGIKTLIDPEVIERAKAMGESMRAERPGAEVAADALEEAFAKHGR